MYESKQQLYEYTKAIFTGQTLEVYRFEKKPALAVSRKRVPRETNDGGFVPTLERRQDNLRRVRRKFLRLVQTELAHKGAPSFATLTFATNVDLSTAFRLHTEFHARLKKEFGNGISYISVPEFQKSGRPHFHILIWGIADHYIKHERERRYLQAIWAYGYLDVIATDGSPKLAGYMAKYMQKAVHDERLLGRRAYNCSRNVMRPLLYKTSAVVHYAQEVLGVDIELLTEKSYQTQWLGAGNYQVFKCKPIT